MVSVKVAVSTRKYLSPYKSDLYLVKVRLVEPRRVGQLMGDRFFLDAV